MQNIQDSVIQNYQDNMDYLEKEHEALFNKIQALEVVLEDGRFPQKYDLEYKDGYFDVRELVSKKFLYNQDTNIYAKTMCTAVNFQKNEHVFETFYNYQFSDKALQKAMNSKDLIMYANSAELIDYHDKNTKKTDHLTKITKFIFIGLGLGVHIPAILEKTGADSLLLIEKDIELFRLSLFVTNYKKIFENKRVFFSIAQNQSEFQETFNSFYLDAFVRNHYIKYSLFSDNYVDAIQNIQNAIISRSEKVYPHEFLINKNIQVLQRINENYNFLNLKTMQNNSLLQEKPLLLIGAGPSLSKNSRWLQENAKYFLIVAAFAALNTLKKLDISPDIVTQMDEKTIATQDMLQKLGDTSFLTDTLFVFSASVPDILIETFSKEKIFLLEDRTDYILANQKILAASVGEFSYAFALTLNPKEIYLLGLDFALTDEGSTHADEHHLTQKLDTNKTTELQESISLDKSILEIQGNLREKVLSTPLLAMSIPHMNNYTAALKKPYQKVYNLSDGAYLEGTIAFDIHKHHKRTETFFDKEKFLKFLQANSQSQLQSNDIEAIKNRQEQIQSFKEALDTFLTTPSLESDIFVRTYTKLLNVLFRSNESELKEILMIYILNTSSYIIDLFATKELTNHKKHIKKMKKIIYNELKNIIKLYEEALLTYKE